MIELSKRAVACRHWRWLPGMWIVDEVGGRGVVLDIVTQGDRPYIKFQNPAHTRQGQVPATWCVPDLSDAATVGCLLALVRNAHRDAYMAAGNDGPVWVVRDCDGYEVCRGTSERAVLVAALEAAP